MRKHLPLIVRVHPPEKTWCLRTAGVVTDRSRLPVRRLAATGSHGGRVWGHQARGPLSHRLKVSRLVLGQSGVQVESRLVSSVFSVSCWVGLVFKLSHSWSLNLLQLFYLLSGREGSPGERPALAIEARSRHWGHWARGPLSPCDGDTKLGHRATACPRPTRGSRARALSQPQPAASPVVGPGGIMGTAGSVRRPRALGPRLWWGSHPSHCQRWAPGAT